jgi:hypothetical protein
MIVKTHFARMEHGECGMLAHIDLQDRIDILNGL